MYNSKSQPNKNSPKKDRRSSMNPTKGCLKDSKKIENPSPNGNKENLRRVSFFEKTHVRHYRPAFGEEENLPPVFPEHKSVSIKLEKTKEEVFVDEENSMDKAAEEQSFEHESFEMPIKAGHDSFEDSFGSAADGQVQFEIPVVEDSDLSIQHDSSFTVGLSGGDDAAMEFISPTGSDFASFQATFSNMVKGTPIGKFNGGSSSRTSTPLSAVANQSFEESPSHGKSRRRSSVAPVDMELTETIPSETKKSKRKSSIVPADMDITFDDSSPGVKTRHQAKEESRRLSTISIASLPEDMEITESFPPNVEESVKISPRTSRRKSSLAPVDMDLTETISDDTAKTSFPSSLVSGKVETKSPKKSPGRRKSIKPTLSENKNPEEASKINSDQKELKKEENILRSDKPRRSLAPKISASPEKHQLDIMKAEVDNPEVFDEGDREQGVSPTPSMKLSFSTSTTPVKHKYKTKVPSRLSVYSTAIEPQDDQDFKEQESFSKQIPIPPPRKSKSAPSTPHNKKVSFAAEVNDITKGVDRHITNVDVSAMLINESPIKEIDMSIQEHSFLASPIFQNSQEQEFTSPRRSSRKIEKLDLTPDRRTTQTPNDLRSSSKRSNKKTSKKISESEWLAEESINLASPGLPVPVIPKLSAQDVTELCQIDEDDLNISDLITENSHWFPSYGVSDDLRNELMFYQKAIQDLDYLNAREAELLEVVENQINSNGELMQVILENFALSDNSKEKVALTSGKYEIPSKFLDLLAETKQEALAASKSDVSDIKVQAMLPFSEYINVQIDQVKQMNHESETCLNELVNGKEAEELKEEYENTLVKFNSTMERAKLFDLNNLHLLDEKKGKIELLRQEKSKIETETSLLEQKIKDVELSKDNFKSKKEMVQKEYQKLCESIEETKGNCEARLDKSVNENYQLLIKCTFWELVGISKANIIHLMYRRMFHVHFKHENDLFLCQSISLDEALKDNKTMSSLTQALNSWLINVSSEEVWIWIQKYFDLVLEYAKWYKVYPSSMIFDADLNVLKITVPRGKNDFIWQFKFKDAIFESGNIEDGKLLSDGWMAQLAKNF